MIVIFLFYFSKIDIKGDACQSGYHFYTDIIIWINTADSAALTTNYYFLIFLKLIYLNKVYSIVYYKKTLNIKNKSITEHKSFLLYAPSVIQIFDRYWLFHICKTNQRWYYQVGHHYYTTIVLYCQEHILNLFINCFDFNIYDYNFMQLIKFSVYLN